MFSTARDMGNFLKYLLNSQNPIHESFFIPGINLPSGDESYGTYTWESVFQNGSRVHTKGGLLSGFGSSIALIPELKLGVVGLLNLNSGDISFGTTKVINLLKPILQKIFVANRRIPSYSGANELLGDYGVSGTVLASLRKSAIENVFEFSLAGISYNYIAYYDEIQSKVNSKFLNSFQFKV